MRPPSAVLKNEVHGVPHFGEQTRIGKGRVRLIGREVRSSAVRNEFGSAI